MNIDLDEKSGKSDAGRQGRAGRQVTIGLDGETLARVDRCRARRGQTRSALVRMLVLEGLEAMEKRDRERDKEMTP